MWPADALWDLGVQSLTLGGILVAYAFARNAMGGRPWRWHSSLAVEPRARRLILALCLAALFTTCGWLGQAATLGVAQTLAMALGGPSAEEVHFCRQMLARASRTGPPPQCVFGGRVSALPAGGWTCEKHGSAPGGAP
jgi:hypothetical protein